MTITFRCEHCHKDVRAPGEAAGRRGKCPHCGQTSYIPAPTAEEDLIDLAPIDEDEECRHQEEVAELMAKEHDLIAETGGPQGPPLDQIEDLKPEDLYHFVVNSCLDMAADNLERVELHIAELRKFPVLARQAVDDFATERATEPALKVIPRRALRKLLAQLRERLH